MSSPVLDAHPAIKGCPAAGCWPGTGPCALSEENEQPGSDRVRCVSAGIQNGPVPARHRMTWWVAGEPPNGTLGSPLWSGSTPTSPDEPSPVGFG